MAAVLARDGLWCGASLRPWQILHSKLARMHTSNLLELDVRELIDETVEAAAHPLREHCNKEEGLILEGEDGELWRHGGLMEARIRDWLTSKLEEGESTEAPIKLHPTFIDDHRTSAIFSGDGRASCTEEYVAGDAEYGFSEEVDTEDEEIYGRDHAYAVSASTHESSNAWYSTSLEQVVYAAVADVLGSRFSDIEEDEENHSTIYTTNAANLAAPLNTETRVCQLSEEQLHEEDATSAICAVCLEKLYMNEEELQVFGVNDIMRLPCRHSFHSACLSPWLSTSSVCPCCRAPITLISCPSYVEAPPNLGVAGTNCSDRVQSEMMGLVAEVEAALGRFGLLS